MKVTVRFLILLFPVLALVVVSFTAAMRHLESQWDSSALNARARVTYRGVYDPVMEALTTGNFEALIKTYDQYLEDPDWVGMLVCSSQGRVISRSPGLLRSARCDWNPDDATTEQALTDSGVVRMEKRSIHRAIFPLFEAGKEGEPPRYRGYLLVYHDLSALSERSDKTRLYTIYAFLGLGILISLMTLWVYRWSVSRPVQQLSDVMKGVLTGDTEKLTRALEGSEFAPLVKDIDQMLMEFRRSGRKMGGAQGADEQQLWGADQLNRQIQEQFGESRVCVLSVDEPFVHSRRGMKIEQSCPSSGTVTALEPIIRAVSGVWIAHGKGSADRETADKHGRILLPPDAPTYALKRVWMSRQEEQGFYYGFSHEGLWPLCHIAHERPIFRHSDWEQYLSVNTRFASVFNEEMKGMRPIALVEGHHFAVLPGLIRHMRPDALVSLYWNIPWPSPENIRICPWRKELLLGMLGADLIGFQLQYHANNFLDSVDRFLEARVSRDHFSVTIQGRTCYVRAIPKSVAWPPEEDVSGSEIPKIRAEVLGELGLSEGMRLGLAVDRLDYTKGILERLQAFEYLLEKHPEWVGKLALCQVIGPSRMHLKRYQDLSAEIQKLAERINWKFYGSNYQPVILRMENMSKPDIYRLYRAADFCYVNSLHDGMNLVAKEFISSRSDVGGVLILSNFSGSVQRLKDALIVNPYDMIECAEAMRKALELDRNEVQARMSRLRSEVAHNNTYAWGHAYFDELYQISEQRMASSGSI